MTITLRGTKGSRLTHAELDANFTSFQASDGSSNVGFIQSGTGAVATTAQAELREKWVSITQFGGSVSASAATNAAAILAAAAEAANHGDAGGVVYIPGNSSAYSCSPIDFDALGERIQLRGDSMRASRLEITGGSTGAGTAAIKYSLSGFSWAGIRDINIKALSAYERVLDLNAPDNDFKMSGVLLDANSLADYNLYATGGSVVHLDNVYTTGALKKNFFSKNQSNSTQWLIVGGNHEIGAEGIMYVESTNQGPNIYLYGGRYETCTSKHLFQFDTTGGQLRIFGSMFTDGAASSIVRKVAASTPIWHLDIQLANAPTNIYSDAAGGGANDIAYASGNNNALMLGHSSPLLVHAGSVSAPAIAALGDSGNGFWSPAAGQWRYMDRYAFDSGANAIRLSATQSLLWADNAALTSATANDVGLARGAANVLQLASGDSFRPADASAQKLGDDMHTWRVYHDVVATGSLPAAATAMNGVILIEDAGAGDRNLIVYAGGERFRIDGGAAF